MIEVPSVLAVTGAFVGTALFLSIVLFGVPALATQKLQIEGERIRDEVVDAVLEGELGRGDSEVRHFLQFCHIVTCHTKDLRLGRVLSMHWAFNRTGWTPASEPATTSPLLVRYERELDGLVSDYFINGSRLWWLLVPLRLAWRAVRPLLRVSTPHEASAYQLAVGLRAEVADSGPESAAVRALIAAGDEHREDRTLVPA